MSKVGVAAMDTLVWQAFASVIVPGTGSPKRRDLSSVILYCSVHWTSHFLQGTRKTRCLSGQGVNIFLLHTNYKKKYFQL